MTTKSLRRELEEFDPHLKNENEDLSNRSAESLRKEVLALRHQLNQNTMDNIHAVRGYRDVLSHSVTGKTDEYLALNQTCDEEDCDIPIDSDSGCASKEEPAVKEKQTTHTTEKPNLRTVMSKAADRALGGGLPGAAAMGAQVISLMWLRTTMNYQYRHGTTTTQALKHLYKEGGIPRFYRGIGPAMIQGPMSRFGDTAANAGVLSLLDSYESTASLPVPFKTAAASFAAALWRINLMPIDMLKTTLQVEGTRGFSVIRTKIATSGPGVLYHGALGASAATFAGHLPWFTTYNTLNAHIPVPDSLEMKLARNAFLGFCSSLVSDCVSNSLRVMKTTKQTSEVAISYKQAISIVMEKDGLLGLFGRGLKTRLLANATQGALFSVAWKFFESQYAKRT